MQGLIDAAQERDALPAEPRRRGAEPAEPAAPGPAATDGRAGHAPSADRNAASAAVNAIRADPDRPSGRPARCRSTARPPRRARRGSSRADAAVARPRHEQRRRAQRSRRAAACEIGPRSLIATRSAACPWNTSGHAYTIAAWYPRSGASVAARANTASRIVARPRAAELGDSRRRGGLRAERAVAARQVAFDVDDRPHRRALRPERREHAAHRVPDEHLPVARRAEPAGEPIRERVERARRIGPRGAAVARQIRQRVREPRELGSPRDRIEARRRFAEPVDPHDVGQVPPLAPARDRHPGLDRPGWCDHMPELVMRP